MFVDSTRYDLTTLWHFDAPAEAVWETISDAEGWPRWWRGIEEVMTLDPGDAAGLGALRRYVCLSILPFHLTFTGRVTRIEPLRLIEGHVEGDVEGVGCCFFERDGNCTAVRYEWHIRTTRLWMSQLGVFAQPLFRWNHEALMQAGGTGLARYLAAGSARRAR